MQYMSIQIFQKEDRVFHPKLEQGVVWVLEDFRRNTGGNEPARFFV